MTTLTRDLRRALENTVRQARRTAEAGARKVIEQLGVGASKAPPLTQAQTKLRNALRAHGRQLGDRRDGQTGVQAVDRLVVEIAYEQWHRLLFARYLAELDLLALPGELPMPIEDWKQHALETGTDWIELASSSAQTMLPQIFRSDDPVLEVALPPETRSALEDLMKALPRDVFVADDSLGWVYQYWQADRKEEVNRSEKKIGADELPAVTQLFTEDYMVLFLLHNTLGAWWAGKVLAAKPQLAEAASNEDELRAACAVGDVEWTYLRFVREDGKPWRPAAGTFDGWPQAAKDITLLDPCMGSGHFLVFALPMLAAMRAAEDRISAEAAIEAVLRDNLFGLEIDPRCTQIAAFNLALAAWRRIGYRQLPSLHLACSGLSLGVSKAEWLKLAERAAQALSVPPKTDLLGTEDNLFSDAMKRGFERLYDVFARAPWLGSLIDPRSAGGDLVEHGFDDLEPLLAQVMAKAETAELSEMAVAAQGLAKAAQVLAGRFTLIATNVPYLKRGSQDSPLTAFADTAFADARQDLATMMMSRWVRATSPGGVLACVSMQSLLGKKGNAQLRERLLRTYSWPLLARLGSGAFEAISGEVVSVALYLLVNALPRQEEAIQLLDVADVSSIHQLKQHLSGIARPEPVLLSAILSDPNFRIRLGASAVEESLENYATALHGQGVGDNASYYRKHWEVAELKGDWELYQVAPDRTALFSGREDIVLWQKEAGRMADFAQLVRHLNHKAQQWRSGKPNWGKYGVAISLVGERRATIYTGQIYGENCCVVIPNDPSHLGAIWRFVISGKFSEELKKIDSGFAVSVKTMLAVPFDPDEWNDSSDPGPDPTSPESDDPTQWAFHGMPAETLEALQVGTARLLGMRWPAERDPALQLSLRARELIKRCSSLHRHADRDGIVALNPVKGEQPAAARLLALLADSFGSEWSAAKLDGLLAQVGFAGKTLDDWLRDGFFEQHCALFHQRPFVWHIWDGRRDGFHALVNYHRLAAPNGEGRRTLEKLLYSYLGDWIDRQRADQKAGVEGADARVAAAEHLKAELTNILTGEPPYDLFVRWKPLAEQPIGWEPDINDGVRINIRPFMTAKPLGARAKGACILRVTPKIKWDKDRGKEPQRAREDFPWFWGWDPDNKDDQKDFGGRGKEPDGNRWNDLHYTRTFKEAARARKAKG